MCAESLQLCPTLCDPVDCSPPGSFVYGILQARILEWVAMLSSRGSSQPRDQTHISCITKSTTWKAQAPPWEPLDGSRPSLAHEDRGGVGWPNVLVSRFNLEEPQVTWGDLSPHIGHPITALVGRELGCGMTVVYVPGRGLMQLRAQLETWVLSFTVWICSICVLRVDSTPFSFF